MSAVNIIDDITTNWVAHEQREDEVQDFVNNHLTEKKFVKWLRAQPKDTKLVCGSPQKCALAQYLVNQEDFPEWAKSINVDGLSVSFVTYAKQKVGIRNEYFAEAPGWAGQFVAEFDDRTIARDMKSGRSPLNTLKVLNQALGRRFRISR